MSELLQEIEICTENAKCFLCDGVFNEGDQPLLLFEKRLHESGEIDCPVSVILSSILGKQLEEDSSHSKVICEGCHMLIQEFEVTEQRYLDLKYKIIHDYNRTARRHGKEIVQLEAEEDDEFTLALVDHGFTTTQSENAHQDGEEKAMSDQDCIIDPISVPIELMTILNHSQINEHSEGEHEQGKEIVEIDENVEQFVGKIKNEQFYEESTDNLAEIMSEEVHYEQIIDPQDEQTNSEDDTSVIEQFTNNINIIQSGGESNNSMCSNIAIKQEDQEDPLLDDPISIESPIIGKSIKRRRKSEQCSLEQKPIFECREGKYFCILCPPSIEKKDDDIKEFDIRTIVAHLKSEHNVRVYICDICGEDFRKRIELTEHVDNHHGETDDGQFQCETCNRIFTNLRLYRIHKRLHYTSTKQFLCIQCNKKYSSKNLLEEHMNMHTGRRPYKCRFCPKDFASKYTLTAHMKIHSERPRPYSCTQCSKAFFSAQNLQQHLKTHSGVKEFICEICNKAFVTQHNLEVHKVVHTGYKPFICRTCGKAFARRAEIKDHERTHTGEKPFSCDICKMSFAQRSNLTTHKRATHFNDKRYKCDRCDRSFKRRRLLDYHIRATHTGERPYKCEMCAATFVYPEHYKKHLRIHTGVKPYACEVCGKTFNSRDNRNAHRFIHSDKKPYECLVCGHGFMRKPLLYTHMQQSGHLNDTIVVNQPRVSDAEIDGSKDIDNNHFIDETITEDSDVVEEHLIIDGSVHLSSNSDNQIIEEADEVPTEILASDISEVITPDQILVTDDGHYIKTEDGTLQMVQIRTKDEDGKERFAWVNLVSEKES